MVVGANSLRSFEGHGLWLLIIKTVYYEFLNKMSGYFIPPHVTVVIYYKSHPKHCNPQLVSLNPLASLPTNFSFIKGCGCQDLKKL